jgi:hypothetical protein
MASLQSQVQPPALANVKFLSLPPELLIDILALLPYPALFAAQRTCAALHALITSTPRLQYALTLSLAGASATATGGPAIPPRLAALRAREDNWRALAFTGTTPIPVAHRASGIYDLTSGVYLLGEAAPAAGTTRGADIGSMDSERRTAAVRYVRLPGRPVPPGTPKWGRIAVGEDIVDVGLNLPEHDLIAVITQCVPPSAAITRAPR